VGDSKDAAQQALYIRAVNRCGALLAGAGWRGPRLDAANLLSRARRSTGLEDFGDPRFEAGLQVLVESLQSEARLSQIGRITAALLLHNLLCVRLRLLECRARRPDIAAQPIRRPLFITGLPRTGTTILHELLAQDPALRSPASWEVARPVPPPTADSYENDGRIAFVGRLLGLAEQLSPGLQAIHALGARLPQECVYLLASCFHSEQFAYMFDVPRYREWLLEQDMAHAYRWHHDFLQHLQVDCARERWVLKTPAHLGSLAALAAQYPDAAVVWTHRRPLQAVASFASLTCTLRGGFSDGVVAAATGPAELDFFAGAVAKGMAERAALEPGRFLDVGFSAICTRPLEVIEAIYTHWEMPLSDEAHRRMRDYLGRRPPDLYGEHRYDAASFGIEGGRVDESFGDYARRFGEWMN